jgi:hypothetical protein
MKTNKKRTAVIAVLLAVTVLTGVIVTSFASTKLTSYTDVKAGYWGEEAIAALTKGGLVKGYGGNKFGPSDPLNIDQMATIICNALGYPSGTKNGYWAYDAVEHCIDIKVLPSQGEITSANYSVPCTRELAVYMFVKAFGVANEGTTYRYIDGSLITEYIPDWGYVSDEYRTEVLNAYRYGIIEGVDSDHNFKPKATITRAEIATICYRTGHTTAATVATTTTEVTKTNEELFEEIKNWGIWDYEEETSLKTLTAKDEKYGKLQVILNTNAGVISVKAKERNGGFYYDARQLTLRVLQTIFPTHSADAYDAFKGMMLEELYEYGGSQYASAIRWYDGRCLKMEMNGIYPGIGYTIDIYKLNDVNAYNILMKSTTATVHRDVDFYIGTKEDAHTTYEYDKW